MFFGKKKKINFRAKEKKNKKQKKTNKEDPMHGAVANMPSGPVETLAANGNTGLWAHHVELVPCVAGALKGIKKFHGVYHLMMILF